MTRGELSVLEVLVTEFRDFREADREWKEATDARLRKVEAFVTSKRAVEERDQARGVSRRAYVAATISAIGVGASIILGLVNYLS